DIKLYLKSNIQPVISDRDGLLRTIDKYYSDESTRKVLEEFEKKYTPVNFDDIEKEEEIEVTSAPIVRLINSIMEQAVRYKASDIHIEPGQKNIRVRFRIDGDLREIMVLPITSLSGIITRIKIIGKMDIAEKRIPQDGRV